MPSAIIEVQYKNAPREGKVQWSVKAADGTYYGLAKGKENEIQQGGVYEVFFEDRDFRGKTYHTIQTVKPVSSQAAPAAGKVLASAERARTPDAESKQIWVCALLVAAIKAGNVNILEGSDLLTATENAILARERLMDEKAATAAKQPAPKTNSQASPDDDMSDEVPF